MTRLVLAATLGSYFATAFGQVPAKAPAFEVASIKSIKGADGSDSESTPGRLHLQGTLKAIIGIAYDLKPDQIDGGTKWIGDEHYDINAKAEGPATGSQMREMLKTLLAERFKLEFHREARTAQGYALVIATGGLKIKEVAASTSHSTHGGNGTLTATNVSIEGLASNLSRRLGMPVTNETGNSAFFDFTLTWSADTGPDSSGPSIFTALQEQLGLKLESRKVAVQMIVVDRADRPRLD